MIFLGRTLDKYAKKLLHLHHQNQAEVAQLVERNLAKVEVVGSNPIFRSTTESTSTGAF